MIWFSCLTHVFVFWVSAWTTCPQLTASKPLACSFPRPTIPSPSAGYVLWEYCGREKIAWESTVEKIQRWEDLGNSREEEMLGGFRVWIYIWLIEWEESQEWGLKKFVFPRLFPQAISVSLSWNKPKEEKFSLVILAQEISQRRPMLAQENHSACS